MMCLGIRKAFDKAGFSRGECYTFCFCGVVYLMMMIIGVLILFGERMIWHLADVCIITQVLVGIDILFFAWLFINYTTRRIRHNKCARLGQKAEYEYRDFLAMESRIGKLEAENEELKKALDLAQEQILGIESLIRDKN